MARTKDQSFVNRYLNQYQQNQKSAVSAGQQAASNAASSGVQQMNATGNIELPSLYDPTEDLYGFVLDQQEAQLKAQQAAAKAAQKAQEKARKEAQKAQKQAKEDAEKAVQKTESQESVLPSLASLQAQKEAAKSTSSAQKETAEDKTPGFFQKVGGALSSFGGGASRVASKISENLDNALAALFPKVNTENAADFSQPGLSLTWQEANAMDAQQVPEWQKAQAEAAAQQAERVAEQAAENAAYRAYSRLDTKDKMDAQAILRTTITFGTEEEKVQAQKELAAVEKALWNDEGYLDLVQKSLDAEPEDSRIQRYLDPSYKLNKLEEKDAKEIAETLLAESKEHYADMFATQEQRDEASMKRYYAQLLISKTSDLQAIGAGVLDAIPLFKEGMDKLSSWANEKIYPGEDLPTAADIFQGAQKQSPIAYGAGNVGGNLALYAAGSAAARSVPVLQKVGQAAAATPVAQTIQKVPVLGHLGTADAITGIVGDTAVDLALDTLPSLGNDIIAYNRQQEAIDQGLAEGKTMEEMLPSLEEYQGEYLTPGGIAADTLKGVGTNLAFNLGGELVPELLKVGGRNLRQASTPVPSLDDGVEAAAKAVGNTNVPSLDDAAQAAARTVNDAALPSLENAAQAAQSGVDDVVNAWRSGTLTNAQLETLKPGGANRAAFEQATGVKLPDTSSGTRQFLRQSAEVPSLEPGMPAGTVAADNAPPSLHDGLPESIGAMRHNPRSYAGMQVEYGTIAPGENAARVVDVPISTDGTDRVSASARTFMEAPQTTDELVGMFEKGVEDGLFSHDVKRDADSLARAVSKVEQDGYQKTLEYWKGLMRDGASLNKEQIVQGQLLYTLAAKNGDTATAMDLAGDLARIATEAGQNLQAQRLLKRMTPEGKLYYAQQTVDSFNRQLKQQLGEGFQDIEIPEELARTLMDAKDAKAQNDAMQNIYQYVADQLPADWGTRWNAWRYLAMLSNPATHVRNVLSNAVNVPARKFKNILGAGIERLTLEEGQRTKSIINPLSASDRELVNFAKNDIENVMPQLTGAQKYSDRSAIKQMVDPFKVNGTWGKNADSNILAKGARSAADVVSGGLSSAYKFNSWALGAEDMLFKKGAYVDSLSQYLKANGIDPAKATQKQLDAAREYAVEEALRATYTEFNSMAQALGKVERKNLFTKVFFGGVVPFKSTPFNIIRRGVRYSPVGLMESVTNGVRRLRAGEINANQFIDNISQGLSGTAIFGLGMWLGANGIINGISPENKEEQSLKSSQGWQNYSINLPGGGTYTIDWGGPSVMAILAGVETAKAFEKDGYDFNEVLTALGNITEPMFDTTMLDGVNSAIQSATYAGSNPVTALVSQAASNFVTQAIPSLSGVVARAYDPVRRTAYSDQEGAFGTIDESKQRIMNKVPGQSTQNQPYIDVWGREQENPGGSFVGRLAYNMLSPGYYSPDRRTVADGVVEDLYQQTGDTGMLPGLFGNSVTVDGEKIRLSPDDYTLAKQTKGQASNQMIESLYDYPQYNMADTEVQADVVKGVYDLANDVAKYQVVPSLYDELVSDIESGDASKSEMLAAMYLTGGAEQVIPYLVADELTSDVRADKNAKGNSIPGSREKNFIETLMQNGYTRGDAEALYQLLK